MKRLSLDEINEKKMKYLGEGSFLEKEHLQKLPRGIPVYSDALFSLTEVLMHVKIYYKGIMIPLPTLTIDEKGNLHDGVICLMIVGLTRNVPYVLHSIHKQHLNGDCVEGAIL